MFTQPSKHPGSSIGPSPAEEMLRQALGSNSGDVRFSAMLLAATALIAVIVVFVKRRKQRQAYFAQEARED